MAGTSKAVGERLAVYTNALGWSYQLPPVVPAENVDYVCFTDQDIRDDQGWTCVRVTPFLEADPFRSSREQKVRTHRWLRKHTKSIYIDSTVLLTCDPQRIWDALIPTPSTLFGGFFHSYRDTVSDEFRTVRRKNLERDAVLDEHKSFYETHYRNVLQEKPIWGGVLARRHQHPECIEAMETWFAHILRYSRRDQLSLPAALSRLDATQIHLISTDIRKSDFHEWPFGSRKKPPYQKITKSDANLSIRAVARGGETQSGGLAVLEDPKTQKLPPPTARTSFGFDEEKQLYFAEEIGKGQRVYVSHHKRLALYKRGIFKRRRQLLRDYSLPRNFVSKGDIVLDVGANIGEIGMWCEGRGAKYYAFEPDPDAVAALRANVAGHCFDIAQRYERNCRILSEHGVRRFQHVHTRHPQ